MSGFRVALVALSAAALTAACAAGQHAATAQEHPSIDGTSGSVGKILLEGVSIFAPTARSYATGADVPMTVYLANNGDTADKLVNISSSAFPGGWSVEATGNLPTAAASSSTNPYDAPTGSSAAASGVPQSIGANSALGLGIRDLTPDGSASTNTIVLKGLANTSAPLYPGTAVKVTFTFAKAGSTTLTVPVQITDQPNTGTLPASYVPPSD